MIERLLLATDLSARSEPALDRALLLSDGAAERIGFLHTIDPEVSVALIQGAYGGTPPVMDELLDARLALDARRPEILIRKGDPHEEIVAASQQRSDDLIVMGQPRVRGFLDSLRGTTLERVIRASTLPVLSVRGPVSGPYRHIVFMTDLSDASAFALVTARRLGFLKGARLTVVHALWPPKPRMMTQHGMTSDDRPEDIAADKEFAIKAVNDLLRGMEPRAVQGHVIVMEGTPRTVIQKVMKDSTVDLVVLGTRGRSGVLRFILGGTAEDLLDWLTVDVLVVPPSHHP